MFVVTGLLVATAGLAPLCLTLLVPVVLALLTEAARLTLDWLTAVGAELIAVALAWRTVRSLATCLPFRFATTW